MVLSLFLSGARLQRLHQAARFSLIPVVIPLKIKNKKLII
jgi:hypothetical protein